MNFTKKLLQSRNEEIKELKKKISLQDIDIKTLSVSKDLFSRNPSSDVVLDSDLKNIHVNGFPGNLNLQNLPEEVSESLLFKMKVSLNLFLSCVE